MTDAIRGGSPSVAAGNAGVIRGQAAVREGAEVQAPAGGGAAKGAGGADARRADHFELASASAFTGLIQSPAETKLSHLDAQVGVAITDAMAGRPDSQSPDQNLAPKGPGNDPFAAARENLGGGMKDIEVKGGQGQTGLGGDLGMPDALGRHSNPDLGADIAGLRKNELGNGPMGTDGKDQYGAPIARGIAGSGPGSVGGGALDAFAKQVGKDLGPQKTDTAGQKFDKAMGIIFGAPLIAVGALGAFAIDKAIGLAMMIAGGTINIPGSGAKPIGGKPEDPDGSGGDIIPGKKMTVQQWMQYGAEVEKVTPRDGGYVDPIGQSGAGETSAESAAAGEAVQAGAATEAGQALKGMPVSIAKQGGHDVVDPSPDGGSEGGKDPKHLRPLGKFILPDPPRGGT